MSEIRTRRLRGRAVEEADAPFIARLFAAPQVGRWISAERAPWRVDESRARAREFVAHWRAHGFGMRVWEERGAPTALAGLHFAVMEGRGAVEASFAVAPAAWGRGLGREALAGALGDAPEGCREVLALVLRDNLRAMRVLRAVGFAPAQETENPVHALMRRETAP